MSQLRLTPRRTAAKLFKVLRSNKSDAAVVGALTLPNHSKKYSGGRLEKRYKRLAPLHVTDLRAAKAAAARKSKR